jgi:hypothetical protein
MAKKNQKYRKQKQSKTLLWLFVALGGLLLIAAMLFANQNSGSGTPSIAVDQQKIDYGDVKFGVEKSFAIKVTNKGNGALRFKEDPYIEVLEGC